MLSFAKPFVVLVSLVTLGCGSSTPTEMPDGEVSVPSADANPDASVDGSSAAPICSCFSGAGLYCDASIQAHASAAGCTVPALGTSANNLFECTGTKTDPGTWAVAQACATSCNVAPPGVDDSCTNPNAYYLPWAGGATYTCTQGHNQGSHTGAGVNAWDFGTPNGTPIWAARAGTVSMVQFLGTNDACYNGVPVACTSCFSGATDCTNRGNYVVINHGDGTQALYLHLSVVGVAPGQAIHVGQAIGQSGTSGCACGAHLHYMVETASNTSYYAQSIASTFVEAGVPTSGQVVTSQNP